MSPSSALLLVDLQRDFLHPNGAYGREGCVAPMASGLTERLAPALDTARSAGMVVVATQFTLVPGPGGEPIVNEHLRRLRPFLGRGDFAAGEWGHGVLDELGPIDAVVEKIAYSAFAHTRLEWVLRRFGVERLVVAGITTNGGVASTVRDAHVREFDVTVLGDGCAAFSEPMHDATLTSLSSVARVTTIAEWCDGSVSTHG